MSKDVISCLGNFGFSEKGLKGVGIRIQLLCHILEIGSNKLGQQELQQLVSKIQRLL